MAMDFNAAMSIGELREHLIEITDLGFTPEGNRLHESRKVFIRVGGELAPLRQVSVTAAEGVFIVILADGPMP